MKTTESFLGFDFDEIELCERQERAITVGQQTAPAQALALETAAKRYEYWQLELEAMKAKHKIIRELLDADETLIENKLNWYSRQIQMALPPGPESELVTENVAVYYKKSERVITPTIDDLPLEYTRVKTEPDEEAIERALKAGKAINGCAIEVRWKIQVKPGGLKAKEAQKRRAKARAKTLVEAVNEVVPITNLKNRPEVVHDGIFDGTEKSSPDE